MASRMSATVALYEIAGSADLRWPFAFGYVVTLAGPPDGACFTG